MEKRKTTSLSWRPKKYRTNFERKRNGYICFPRRSTKATKAPHTASLQLIRTTKFGPRRL